MFEIRHAGSFVARFETEQEALDAAPKMFSDLQEVTVKAGGPFELHCRDGFITSFHSEEEANAALESFRTSHAAHVERGGPEALRARFAKHPVLKGRPVPALHDDKDPELKIVEGAEEKPGTEVEVSASEIPASEMETDPAPAEPPPPETAPSSGS